MKKLLFLLFVIRDKKAILMMVVSVLFLLIISLTVLVKIMPHEHLSVEASNVTEITIVCGEDKITFVDYADIKNMVKRINRIHLYQSDEQALPSSPEKFIKINLKNGIIIEIKNVGMYSLIIYTYAENDIYKILYGDIFLTSFFVIDNILLGMR